jgi:CDGSH-type Zn-finger protein
METPKRAGDSPIEVNLEKGKTYAWCACGLSKNQPFCDGSHKVTSFTPKIFVAEESGVKHLCMCKGTKNKPFCDGSHHQ